MTRAAELLRGLDAKATGAPWTVEGSFDGFVTGSDCNVCDQPGKHYDGHAAWDANARCIATTRNLLPLLAGLVEALGDFMDPGKEDDVDANYQRVERAYAALNAAAEKEAE